MKQRLTAVGCIAGLAYGGAAVLLAYPDSPTGLQVFIVAGVGAVGAAAGWLLGLLVAACLPQR